MSNIFDFFSAHDVDDDVTELLAGNTSNNNNSPATTILSSAHAAAASSSQERSAPTASDLLSRIIAQQERQIATLEAASSAVAASNSARATQNNNTSLVDGLMQHGDDDTTEDLLLLEAYNGSPDDPLPAHAASSQLMNTGGGGGGGLYLPPPPPPGPPRPLPSSHLLDGHSMGWMDLAAAYWHGRTTAARAGPPPPPPSSSMNSAINSLHQAMLDNPPPPSTLPSAHLTSIPSTPLAAAAASSLTAIANAHAIAQTTDALNASIMSTLQDPIFNIHRYLDPLSAAAVPPPPPYNLGLLGGMMEQPNNLESTTLPRRINTRGESSRPMSSSIAASSSPASLPMAQQLITARDYLEDLISGNLPPLPSSSTPAETTANAAVHASTLLERRLELASPNAAANSGQSTLGRDSEERAYQAAAASAASGSTVDRNAMMDRASSATRRLLEARAEMARRNPTPDNVRGLSAALHEHYNISGETLPSIMNGLRAGNNNDDDDETTNNNRGLSMMRRVGSEEGDQAAAAVGRRRRDDEAIAANTAIRAMLDSDIDDCSDDDSDIDEAIRQLEPLANMRRSNLPLAASDELASSGYTRGQSIEELQAEAAVERLANFFDPPSSPGASLPTSSLSRSSSSSSMPPLEDIPESTIGNNTAIATSTTTASRFHTEIASTEATTDAGPTRRFTTEIASNITTLNDTDAPRRSRRQAAVKGLERISTALATQGMGGDLKSEEEEEEELATDSTSTPTTSNKRKAAMTESPDNNKRVKKDEKDDTPKTCCICLEEPTKEELSTINVCTHPFCFTCIEKWSDQTNKCPLCKTRFFKIDKVHKPKKRKAGEGGVGSSCGGDERRSKRVRNRDLRSDHMHFMNPLEGMFASMEPNGTWPTHIAQLLFSGLGAGSLLSPPFGAMPSTLPSTSRGSALEEATRQHRAAAERVAALRANIRARQERDNARAAGRTVPFSTARESAFEGRLLRESRGSSWAAARAATASNPASRDTERLVDRLRSGRSSSTTSTDRPPPFSSQWHRPPHVRPESTTRTTPNPPYHRNPFALETSTPWSRNISARASLAESLGGRRTSSSGYNPTRTNRGITAIDSTTAGAGGSSFLAGEEDEEEVLRLSPSSYVRRLHRDLEEGRSSTHYTFNTSRPPQGQRNSHRTAGIRPLPLASAAAMAPSPSDNPSSIFSSAPSRGRSIASRRANRAREAAIEINSDDDDDDDDDQVVEVIDVDAL